MADELSLSLSLNFDKGVTITAERSGTVTVAGNAGIKNAVTVTTFGGALQLGGVVTVGYVYLKNLDATNYITFGADGSTYPLKLKAGEFALFRYNATALIAKANGASCLLEYAVIPD